MLNALPVNFPLYPVADPLGLARNQGPIFLPTPYQISGSATATHEKQWRWLQDCIADCVLDTIGTPNLYPITKVQIINEKESAVIPTQNCLIHLNLSLPFIYLAIWLGIIAPEQDTKINSEMDLICIEKNQLQIVILWIS